MLSMDDLFMGRHFDREVMILCVRWYLRFKLSFRDLVEMMAERGISLVHATIMRWIARYVPEFEKRWNHFACRTDVSWRVDETYVKSKAGGLIFTAPSTSKERRWIFCSEPSRMLRRQKRFSVGRSKARVDCRRSKTIGRPKSGIQFLPRDLSQVSAVSLHSLR